MIFYSDRVRNVQSVPNSTGNAEILVIIYRVSQKISPNNFKFCRYPRKQLFWVSMLFIEKIRINYNCNIFIIILFTPEFSVVLKSVVSIFDKHYCFFYSSDKFNAESTFLISSTIYCYCTCQSKKMIAIIISVGTTLNWYSTLSQTCSKPITSVSYICDIFENND